MSSTSRLHPPSPASDEAGPSNAKPWVDPTALPPAPGVDVAAIRGTGNVSDYAKQLVCNVFSAYGVGARDQFGYAVGRAVKWVEMSVEVERGGDVDVARTPRRMEAVTIAELTVTKHMLNGAGMLHGGCVTYLIDNCASTPLVLLGVLSGTNGVGVTQGMNVLFHAPAPVGSLLRITSSSIAMGSRIMSARCEITDATTARVVASAFLNKMQPQPAKTKAKL
ncbi:HotDog domain-containing protein [Mycena albidolilacea]|uniref:HotDog domain-containing protein n=1 Tax=Mycena albidolilacea TaxID=1033008 RepID=A0AAD7E7U8_9AGAR|nr:HotDog domain-containing protein [Mycena albidolilacea]